VKLFNELGEAEQKAWWLEQAKEALAEMGMADAEANWLAYTHNAVFSVQYQDTHYVLRLQSGDEKPQIALRTEATWLQMIQQSGKVKVPSLIWADMYVPYIMLDINDAWVYGFLFEYLDGVSINLDELSSTMTMQIGQALAELHKVKMPQEWLLREPSLDYQGLFSKRYPLTDSAKILFSPAQLNVMDTVAQVVKSAMDELGQGEGEFGLIHGDLLLKNILFHEGEVRALDFEYCGWGYYLYDLCPLLWQLKPLQTYKELEEALWNGYCSIRPLTDRHRQRLETFIAARQVASLRWVAANQHNPAYQGKVQSILQQRTAELQGFLETGILKRS
jgi:Ser/Thr protein kinase RdoA (MazF antagonist)